MATIRSFIDSAGETVTWYRRTLTDRDEVTNWPAVSWLAAGDFSSLDFDCDDFLCDVASAYSIKVMFKPLGSRETDQHAGRISENRVKMETYADVEHLDRIVYDGQIYEVESEPINHNLRGVYYYKTCVLVYVGDE